jgi:hypothetical protein
VRNIKLARNIKFARGANTFLESSSLGEVVVNVQKGKS